MFFLSFVWYLDIPPKPIFPPISCLDLEWVKATLRDFPGEEAVLVSIEAWTSRYGLSFLTSSECYEMRGRPIYPLGSNLVARSFEIMKLEAGLEIIEALSIVVEPVFTFGDWSLAVILLSFLSKAYNKWSNSGGFVYHLRISWFSLYFWAKRLIWEPFWLSTTFWKSLATNASWACVLWSISSYLDSISSNYLSPSFLPSCVSFSISTLLL